MSENKEQSSAAAYNGAASFAPSLSGKAKPRHKEIRVISGKLIKDEYYTNDLSKSGKYERLKFLVFQTPQGVLRLNCVDIAHELKNLMYGAKEFYLIKWHNFYFIFAVRDGNGRIVQATNTFVKSQWVGMIPAVIMGVAAVLTGLLFLAFGIKDSSVGGVIFGLLCSAFAALVLSVVAEPAKARKATGDMKKTLRKAGWGEGDGGHTTW